MRLSLISVLFITPTVLWCDAELTWWTTHPLAKVKPGDAVPTTPVKSVEIYAGRNEFEPFQIVLRAGDQDVPGVDIEVSDFRTSDGAEISKKNVTVYLERFLNLEKPSSIEGGTGLWPDPLVPRIDRYAGEKRNAFPFTVRQGRNQPLWVEVFVPPTATPGSYSGQASISLGKQAQIQIPIQLTVWNFTLPSTATLKSSFGLSGVTALKKHRGSYTSDADLFSISRIYAKAALLHRISIHGGSMAPPPYQYSGGKMRVDWRRYDSEVAPFLDGTVLTSGEPLAGAVATSVDIRMPTDLEADEPKILYYNEWSKHFKEKGWLDRLFLYLWDEPPVADFPKVLARGQVAMKADPSVRTLVTTMVTPKLKEVVKIWTPLVNCIKNKPGPETFCDDVPPLKDYDSEIQKGKSLWFYQSCGSHGCSIVGGPYFTGWPSYMIDISGAANRVMQWMAWKFRMEGELYYAMNEAYGYDTDPWTSVYLSGGNGDGTLFYPGRPDRIGGRTHIPIESIRLKLIREGMEDYEYLALLAKSAGRGAASRYADQIVKELYSFESKPEAFLKVRLELGKALNGPAATASATDAR
jgi:hypothetical protein